MDSAKPQIGKAALWMTGAIASSHLLQIKQAFLLAFTGKDHGKLLTTVTECSTAACNLISTRPTSSFRLLQTWE